MAIISVKKQGHLSSSENAGATNKTATEVYVVQFDAPASTVAAETANDGVTAIPAYGAGHPDDSNRKVSSVKATAENEGKRMVYTVTVTYSTRQLDTYDNPLSRPAEVTWDFSEATESYFIDEDTDGPKAVANTAGEPFENLLERETGTITVTIKQNVASFNPATAVEYMKPNALNNDAFTIEGNNIAIGQAKFSGITCSPSKTENGVTYRERTIVLKLAESWQQEVESRGRNEVDPDNAGKLREIVKGTPPTKVDTPWPLDADGAALPNIDDDPATITFIPYRGKPFGVWGIT